MDHLFLLLDGHGGPDSVELRQRAPEIVAVDILRVDVGALDGKFRQPPLGRLDVVLKTGHPLEPRAGVDAVVRRLARQTLVELPEASHLGVQLLVNLLPAPPPASGRSRCAGRCRGPRIQSPGPGRTWFRSSSNPAAARCSRRSSGSAW